MSCLQRGVGPQESAAQAELQASFGLQEFVFFPPSLRCCVCVFPSFLTEGILPSWLPATRVVTPGPTLEWQPQPRPLPACDFIPSLSCFCTLGLLGM